MNEQPRIRGVLLDLSGVLYVGSTPLPGAVRVLRKLKSSGLPVRYVTNTTRQPQARIVGALNDMGFAIQSDEVFTPVQAALDHLRKHAQRPHLLVHPDLRAEFAGLDQQNPNAVVLGDAAQAFDYASLNAAFRLLMDGAQLLALGDNRYFRDADGLSLDIGPFKAALEYAADTRACVLGKPAAGFFLEAVSALGCAPGETIMVGDDAVADVEGALGAGLQGVLVRTGKYRNGDEDRIARPGARTVDDLAAAVELILSAA